MADVIEILQCPDTGRPLRGASDRELVAADDGPTYQYLDGVGCLLPKKARADSAEGDPLIASAIFARRWVGNRTRMACLPTPKPLSTLAPSRSISAANAFPASTSISAGAVDTCSMQAAGRSRKMNCCRMESGSSSGSASIFRCRLYAPHDQRLATEGFICKRLTNLPLKDGSMDAVTCNHVIYQVPAESQAAAFLELWRVLKPGGIGVIVYWWRDTPLAWRIERLARLFVGNRSEKKSEILAASATLPELYHHPHSLSWFESQNGLSDTGLRVSASSTTPSYATMSVMTGAGGLF